MNANGGLSGDNAVWVGVLARATMCASTPRKWDRVGLDQSACGDSLCSSELTNQVACAAGNIGAPCAGEDDDAACDSSPGAGDGWCDACSITAGVTTENEMFVLTPTYLLP